MCYTVSVKKARNRLNWQEVLGKQLEIGMKDVDTSRVVIVYEPVNVHETIWWNYRRSGRVSYTDM